MVLELSEKEEQARKMVCLPLDNIEYLTINDAEIAFEEDQKKDKILTEVPVSMQGRVQELSPVVGLFKVGFESFTRYGPEAIKLVQDAGSDVFLDLKFNDIPNTVKGAAAAAAEKGVYMINVHANGGKKMMENAMEGVMIGSKNRYIKEKLTTPNIPKVVGVTVLTSYDEAKYLQTFQTINPSLGSIDFDRYVSMGDNAELREEFNELLVRKGLTEVVQNHVRHLAKLTEQAGLDGIVCAAADLSFITEGLPSDFMYVTPGIAGPNQKAGADQARVYLPGDAVRDGASILVTGRAITGPKTAEGRVQAGYEVVQHVANVL
ncbi:hypothetical protein GOV05_02975 [Candidatus Woesearchaeota archaeon]|nr:hypothetical protein [Candidatus Woesearchaeota archaeon]